MKIAGFILFFFIFQSELLSQKIIEGNVSKIGGGILSAVEVKAKEAPAIFTFTDDKGNYRIEVPNEVKYLSFSYSGMQVKTVKVGEFLNINVKLIPTDYQKLRYGIGLKFGVSNFTLLPSQSQYILTDTVIHLKPISLDLNLFYRLKKNFDIQGVLEDDLNPGKVNKDSVLINNSGVPDTVKVEEKFILNRISAALMVNYNIKLGVTGNYSAFLGIGPQFQHFSFLNTGTVGMRIQFGTNINNYGKTIRTYFALDIAGGEFGDKNIYVPGLKYNYFSFRTGISFVI